MTAISLCALNLALEHTVTCTKGGVEQACEMNDGLRSFVVVMDLVFIVVFGMEAVIKVVGLGLVAYFTDALHLFDFFILVTAVCEVCA